MPVFRDSDYLPSPDVNNCRVAWISELLDDLVSLCSVDRELGFCHRSVGGWLVNSGCRYCAVEMFSASLASAQLIDDGRYWHGSDGCRDGGAKDDGPENYCR